MPSSITFVQTYVHCGPAAPMPEESTADTFRMGVEMWLYR
jgi:hypothetical protein